MKSDDIKNLAVALMKFNLKVGSISKDKKNPFFKSDYVTLDKLILSTREILAEEGLSVMQFPYEKDGMVGVKTMLIHQSGEYIENDGLLLKPAKNDPQAYGSAVTYARRYSYQAILNLNTGEDDDGNSCSTSSTQELTEGQVKRLYAIASKAGVKKEQVLAGAKRDYSVADVKNLNKVQYEELCKRLEAKAN